MKRLFTLLVAFAVAGVASIQAQVLQRGFAPKTAPKLGILNSTITPGENQAWWGYVPSDADIYGLGVQAATTYHCAIFIPGDNEVASGKTINGIRFYMGATNVSKVQAWVAESKPSSISASTTKALVDVPASDLGGIVDVALPAPYTVTDKGVYVGYSFTITKVSTSADGYPIGFTYDPEAPNTMLLRYGTSAWEDLYGQGFGRLYLQVLLEGQFPANGVSPADFGDQILAIGTSSTASVTLTGTGITPATSIDYTITSDGVAGEEQHAELSDPIGFGVSKSFNLPVDAGGQGCQGEDADHYQGERC